jgi:hypothetical protein
MPQELVDDLARVMQSRVEAERSPHFTDAM